MRDRTTGQIAAERAINMLGGPVRAAAILGVPGARYQTVQSWLRNRVPAEYCPVIERETRVVASLLPGGAVVKCEELRPDIDWGVLRTDLSSAPGSRQAKTATSDRPQAADWRDAQIIDRRGSERRHQDRRSGRERREG